MKLPFISRKRHDEIVQTYRDHLNAARDSLVESMRHEREKQAAWKELDALRKRLDLTLESHAETLIQLDKYQGYKKLSRDAKGRFVGVGK